ncbi:unnamed protein product [Heterobilharzia americana]|nr:unnamed protein product [Heterobilharzia americana]CAH8580281.1 unnamed protein product [Heterobilharzia americana]
MFVRLIPVWLSQEDFSPFLKTGIISDLDQSEGIVFDSYILVNTSVNLTESTPPTSLYTSRVIPSDPASVSPFKLPNAFSTSTSIGESISMLHSGSDWIAGNAMVAGGQINFFSKCSAHLSSRLPASESQIRPSPL